jgi:hypothetical protein
METLSKKKKKLKLVTEKVGSMPQVVEHLTSLNPNTAKKKKKAQKIS